MSCYYIFYAVLIFWFVQHHCLKMIFIYKGSLWLFHILCWYQDKIVVFAYWICCVGLFLAPWKLMFEYIRQMFDHCSLLKCEEQIFMAIVLSLYSIYPIVFSLFLSYHRLETINPVWLVNFVVDSFSCSQKTNLCIFPDNVGSLHSVLQINFIKFI